MDKLALYPVIQKFADSLKNSTPIYKLSPQDARKVLADAQAIAVPTLPVDSQDHVIPHGPKGPINVCIMRPVGARETLPVIIFMHGAGWVLGGRDTHDRLIREIVNGSNAALVFVDYTRAPEGSYPVAHEQGYETAKWVVQQSKSLNVDSSRMAIVGDSVGGLMATAIALMALERGGPKFIFQALLYPVTDANFDTPSYNQYAQGPWLTKAAMQWFWDSYVPDKALRTQPFVSPLQASIDQLKKLPPTFIMTNEYDVLRDEAEAYAHKLIQAGVPVVAVRYLGLIHDSLMLNAITQAPGIRGAIAQLNQQLRSAFL